MQATQDIPKRGVGIAELGSHEEFTLSLGLVGLQDALEEGQELGDARLAEVGGLFERLFLLVVVVLGDGDGVVGIVGFVVEIESGQGMCLDPSLFCLVGASKV